MEISLNSKFISSVQHKAIDVYVVLVFYQWWTHTELKKKIRFSLFWRWDDIHTQSERKRSAVYFDQQRGAAQRNWRWNSPKTHYLKDGSVFTGQFVNGFLNGFGKIQFEEDIDSDYCEGQFKKNRLYGQGTYAWKNGSKYVGQFEDGQRHGFGKLTCERESELDYYEGEWSEDKKSGQGKQVWKNGKVFEGKFKNGEMIDWFLSQTFSKLCVQ